MEHMDALKLFEEHIDHIKDVIRKRCQKYSGEDPDDLAQTIFLKLIEDDYRKVRAFQGKSSFTTYLYTVINHILLDYMRSKKGRWRPTERAKQLGEIAVMLEELVYRDERPLQEAICILTKNHQVSLTDTELQALYEQLPTHDAKSVEDVSEESLLHIASQDSRPDEELENKKLASTLSKTAEVISAAKASLSAEDRLILKMHYENGVAISKIARILIKERSAVERRIQRILADFKERTLAAGINGQDVTDALKFFDK
jgi:RNA polymerase sigma factor (sigma-70 family)